MAIQNNVQQIRGVTASNPLQAQYQYFPEEYFTGADVAVYFGDTWVDEITGMQFTLQENVRPIFGYASRTWDGVARGSRVVQGQIRIAFKEAGYLYTIMDHLGQLKAKAKPRMAYLMGGEKVPNWVAGVKDNIESTLERWNGGLEEIRQVEEEFLDEYEWPTLTVGATDATHPNTKGRKRGGASGTQYIGAVSQLQDRIKSIYPMAAVSFNWKAKGSVPTHPNVLKYHGYPTDYFMIQTWANGKPILSAKDFVGNYKKDDPQIKDLVLRLMKFDEIADYVKKEGISIDHMVYGDNLRMAVAKFLEIAGINDGSQGRWVSSKCKAALEQGFNVDGKFDVPTRMAVRAYQQKYGLGITGIVGDETRKHMSPKGKRKVDKMVSVAPASGKVSPSGQPEPRFRKYEQEIWGRASSANIDHTNRTYFYPDTHTLEGGAYLRKNGFDIYINYGAYAEHVIRWKGQMAGDIDADPVSFNTTIKAIRNVQLTGVTQVMDASGQPVEEIYQFIAKDLD